MRLWTLLIPTQVTVIAYDVVDILTQTLAGDQEIRRVSKALKGVPDLANCCGAR